MFWPPCIGKQSVTVRLESLESLWVSFLVIRRKILIEVRESDYDKSQYCSSEVYEVPNCIWIIKTFLQKI